MSAARDLMRSSADVVVLSVLADGPLYGYAITKRVAGLSDDQIRLTPGMLYPLLHQMEEEGLLVASWDEVHSQDNDGDKPGRRRKWYRLSPKGRRRLAQRAAAHRAYHALMEGFLPDVSQGKA